MVAVAFVYTVKILLYADILGSLFPYSAYYSCVQLLSYFPSVLHLSSSYFVKYNIRRLQLKAGYNIVAASKIVILMMLL